MSDQNNDHVGGSESEDEPESRLVKIDPDIILNLMRYTSQNCDYGAEKFERENRKILKYLKRHIDSVFVLRDVDSESEPDTPPRRKRGSCRNKR